jgi:hypothetical protein
MEFVKITIHILFYIVAKYEVVAKFVAFMGIC